MRGPSIDSPPAIDPVAVAGGLGAVAGVASLAWPFLDGMTAALVALAAVGWLARFLRGSLRRLGPSGLHRWVGVLVLTSVVAGWIYFLSASGAWAFDRGAVLGLAGGFVGWTGRQRPAFGGG